MTVSDSEHVAGLFKNIQYVKGGSNDYSVESSFKLKDRTKSYDAEERDTLLEEALTNCTVNRRKRDSPVNFGDFTFGDFEYLDYLYFFGIDMDRLCIQNIPSNITITLENCNVRHIEFINCAHVDEFHVYNSNVFDSFRSDERTVVDSISLINVNPGGVIPIEAFHDIPFIVIDNREDINSNTQRAVVSGDFTRFNCLKDLKLVNVDRQELNFKGAPCLKYLSLGYSEIEKIDLSDNHELVDVNLYRLPKLKEVNFGTKISKIKSIIIENTSLEHFRLPYSPVIEDLTIVNNQIESVDFKLLAILRHICWYNKLPVAYAYIRLINNKITNLKWNRYMGSEENLRIHPKEKQLKFYEACDS